MPDWMREMAKGAAMGAIPGGVGSALQQSAAGGAIGSAGNMRRASAALAMLGLVPRSPNTDTAMNDPAMLEEHRRLFGPGAMVDAPMLDDEAEFLQSAGAPSMAEQAWMQRPRAAGAGKDIRLPASRALGRSPFGR